MNSYKFCTIVATEENRAQFTKLRDELAGSDKTLFRAIWETMDLDKVKERLGEIKVEDAKAKAEARQARKAAKPTEAKPATVPVDDATKTEVAAAVAELLENEVDNPEIVVDTTEGIVVE